MMAIRKNRHIKNTNLHMKDKIQKDLIQSMKSGSKQDVEILRFIISLIKPKKKIETKTIMIQKLYRS